MRTLIILFAVIVALYIIRFFYRQSPASRKKIIYRALLTAAALLLIFLLATGRLPWVFAAIAAVFSMLYRMLPLIRYVPLLKKLYQYFQFHNTGGAGPASGQQSTVQSRFIRMTLLHDSGEMNGEVLEGQFRGSQLQQLTLQQLMDLYQECQQDQDSCSLLMSYLDRMHPEWRDQGGDEQSTNQSERTQASFEDKMTASEAYQILGLEDGAGEEQIIQAHRRLMQKLHPDHGGSTYLAAKINLAKQVLLKQG